MWVPSEDDAVDIFARHFEALHRAGAIRKAEQTAAALNSRGDAEGHQLWTRVADKIRQLRASDRIATRLYAEGP